MEQTSLTEDEVASLLQRAESAKEASYSPYSKFRVGASLLTSRGSFYSGCNVENASYGLSICAERTTMVKAVSEGEQYFRALCVTSDVEGNVFPCGACRQFLAEFGDFPVYIMPAGPGPIDKRDIMITSTSKLLPHSFGTRDLIREHVGGDLKPEQAGILKYMSPKKKAPDSPVQSKRVKHKK